MHVSFIGRTAFALVLTQAFVARAHAQERVQEHALTLEAAISRALASHPRVGAATEAVRAARGSRLTARSWANPTLNYQSEGSSGSAAPGAPPALEREVMTFGMLPLEPLYQLWPRSAQASAEVRAAEADLAATRRMIALAAAAAFFSAAFAHVSVDALLDVRIWLDSLVGYSRVRVREGVAAEVDLIRLEVEHGRAEIDLAMARVDFARARAQVAAMVGTDSFTVSAAIDTSADASPLPAREALLAQARARRPEIAAANARLEAARSGVSVERSRIVREVGVMAGVKTMAGSRSLMTGFTLPVPLFDQNRGEIRRADAQRRMAAFEREWIKTEMKGAG